MSAVVAVYVLGAVFTIGRVSSKRTIGVRDVLVAILWPLFVVAVGLLEAVDALMGATQAGLGVRRRAIEIVQDGPGAWREGVRFYKVGRIRRTALYIARAPRDGVSR